VTRVLGIDPGSRVTGYGIVDASEACGYPLEAQLELRKAVVERFRERDVPVLTVNNKSDRSRDVEADLHMSVESGDGVDAVLDAAVDAVDWTPDIPPSRQE
jgi:nucleolar GTP-binding protein